jgi:hypothetical protein
MAALFLFRGKEKVMKITYYTDRYIEVLSIKTDDGKPIKEKAYHFGNCLIDLLYGNAIMEGGIEIRINERLKGKVTALLEQCDDYLHNDIPALIENDLTFIFTGKYSYQNVFIENKLSSVYFFDNIYLLISLLLTNIYLYKLMYKRCAYCNRLFATRFSDARFCKRITTKSGHTCRYAHQLQMRRKKHTFDD